MLIYSIFNLFIIHIVFCSHKFKFQKCTEQLESRKKSLKITKYKCQNL